MEVKLNCGSLSLIKGQGSYIAGIVNVTLDSFSDGGQFINANDAINHGLNLLKQGAHFLDIGGYSSAPHHLYVSPLEEISRVIPVIQGLKANGVDAISVDTASSLVAAKALSAGASLINDQSAARNDKDMPLVMKDAEGIIIMHNGGGKTSGVMAGEEIYYDDVIASIKNFFHERLSYLDSFGVRRDKIIIDPGIGFGKGLNDSINIINNMYKFVEFNNISLIGLSRKSFLGKLSSINEPKKRDIVTLAANALAVYSGVDIIRTHNVKWAHEFFLVFDKMRRCS